MPGNQGGSNWGTTAADPQKGLVFVVGVNQVALLQLYDVKKRTAEGRGVSSGEVLDQGVSSYRKSCQSCHGADLRGAVPGASSLLSVTDRLDDDAIRSVVNTSTSHQPRLASINQAELTATIAYLTYVNPGRRGGGGGARGRGAVEPLPPGPVVARGGAPQPPLPPRYSGPFYSGVGGNAGNVPYPSDVEDMPPTRYMSDYGVMATSTKPPYTTLTAYDLNTGTIKWQVTNGDDPRTVAAGGPTGTGAVAARNGLIVTKNGLIFQAGGDGKVRAFDEDTGKVLWTGTIAGQSIGIPTMYQVNGRQFLVMMSPAPGAGGGAEGAAGPAPQMPPNAPHGYIAFALPAK
jgi:quinoprotein glucose dehydrogenase